MAAATQENLGTVLCTPFEIYKVKLTSMTSDQKETLALGTNYAGQKPFYVTYELTTRPTSGAMFSLEHTEDDDTPSSGDYVVRPYVEDGGDIAGAECTVQLWFLDQARQDGQTINSDNNT